jgi:hypothetical protein
VGTEELPKILSDEEFEQLLKAREHALREGYDRWENSGVRPPPRASDGLPESCIEQQFPHVAAKLCGVWPSDACGLYISDLIVNKRGARQGFPAEVIEDLLMLFEVNEMLVRAGNRTPQRAAPDPVAPFADDTLPRRER